MSKGDSKATRLGLSTRLSILAAVMLGIGAVTIVIGVLVFKTGLIAALATWAICSVASLAAHVAGEYPKGDLYFTARMALQMAVRTVPPFGFALWALHFAAPPLETNIVFYIIVFYFVGMIADVQLTLGRLGSGN